LPVDVALVGMGTDGHVASIFPGGDHLAEALAADAPPVLPMQAPGAPEPRITLTLPVLREAFALHLLITGADKRAMVEGARGADPMDLPVAALLKSATVHWAE
jgi:6-phosphogluconolactonase